MKTFSFGLILGYMIGTCGLLAVIGFLWIQSENDPWVVLWESKVPAVKRIERKLNDQFGDEGLMTYRVLGYHKSWNNPLFPEMYWMDGEAYSLIPFDEAKNLAEDNEGDR